MDVSPQILDHHRIYGASDSTKQGYISSSRCLNYGNGGTIQHPELELVSNIPRNIEYQDSVGLFGSENHFIKLTMHLENPVSGLYEINGYETGVLSDEVVVPEDSYTYDDGMAQPGQALIHYDLDLGPDSQGYLPAAISSDSVPNLASKYFKVELKNLKTGNQYVDAWLDVRLYNSAREEHPYDVMYIKQGEFFYIGFHARNTKRLPYNVLCAIGQGFSTDDFPPVIDVSELSEKYRKYLATKH